MSNATVTTVDMFGAATAVVEPPRIDEQDSSSGKGVTTKACQVEYCEERFRAGPHRKVCGQCEPTDRVDWSRVAAFSYRRQLSEKDLADLELQLEMTV